MAEFALSSHSIFKLTHSEGEPVSFKNQMQAEKFLKCDWLRPPLFQPNLNYLLVNLRFPDVVYSIFYFFTKTALLLQGISDKHRVVIENVALFAGLGLLVLW